KRIKALGLKHPLLVTDKTLVSVGLAEKVLKIYSDESIQCAVFDAVHANPIEDDVDAGARIYRSEKCDCVIALGGGSPMDAAKVIMLAVTHEGPLEKYDDALGGDKYITHPLPPLVAIPTTAWRGREVGGSGVIEIRATTHKTIFFHPTILPKIAILEPSLTVGLPSGVTAATGIDAFTYCMEGYFSPGFHPMADGIALEGIRLILKNLPVA